VAAQFRSSYIVQQQMLEFLSGRADIGWISDHSHYLPSKLSKLVDLNAILAHQPWSLTPSHFDPVMKGGDSWSASEIIHILFIMATYRSLSAFCLAMGIAPEPEFCPSQITTTDLENCLRASSEAHVEEKIMEDTVSKLRKGYFSAPGSPASESKRIELFKTIDRSSEENNDEQSRNSHQLFSSLPFPRGWTEDFEAMFPRPTKKIILESFSVRDYQIFHERDFSWENEAYSLVSRFHPSIAKSSDDCFRSIIKLTYKSLCAQEVDTEPFRMAIWYYVHRVNGIFYDDYNYRNVNLLLTPQLKAWIKKVTQTPFKLEDSDVNNIGIKLLPEEKAHIALLAIQAKMQAELLYGLRALNSYLHKV